MPLGWTDTQRGFWWPFSARIPPGDTCSKGQQAAQGKGHAWLALYGNSIVPAMFSGDMGILIDGQLAAETQGYPTSTSSIAVLPSPLPCSSLKPVVALHRHALHLRFLLGSPPAAQIRR